MAETERKFTIIADGFAEGVKTYARLKWLIAVLFAVTTGFVALLSTDSPTVSLVMGTGLAFLGFWFVPDILSAPLNRLSTSVMMKHVSRRDYSINVPTNPPPDFRNNHWPVLNSIREQFDLRRNMTKTGFKEIEPFSDLAAAAPSGERDET